MHVTNRALQKEYAETPDPEFGVSFGASAGSEITLFLLKGMFLSMKLMS